MERVYIGITPENIITIGLMALGTYFVFALLWQMVQKYRGGVGL